MFKKSKKKKLEEEMSFMQHLEVLRWHIMRAVIAVLLFAIAAFVFHETIFNQVILLPRSPEFITNKIMCELAERLSTPSLCINTADWPITNLDLPGQFRMHIHISFMAGIILATPYIIFEIWGFIKPALSPKERKHSNGAVIAISLLFLTGIVFSYFIIVPLTVNFLINYTVSDQIVNQIKVVSYIKTITSVTLATGFAFELPVFVYFLARLGIISPRIMRKYRKYAFLIILILAAIITPPDVFSQFMVLIPIYLLYEMSIGICARVTKKIEKAKLLEKK